MKLLNKHCLSDNFGNTSDNSALLGDNWTPSRQLTHHMADNTTFSCQNKSGLECNALCDISSGILELNLQNNDMSCEERKQAAREHITALHKQVQEREEDKELQQLLPEEEELHKKLSKAPATASGSKDGCGMSNTSLSSHSSNKADAATEAEKLKALTGVQFDMSGFVNKNAGANMAEVDSIFKFTEPIRTLQPTLPAKHKLTGGMTSTGGKKARRDQQESESESDDESGSETEDTDTDDDKRR